MILQCRSWPCRERQKFSLENLLLHFLVWWHHSSHGKVTPTPVETKKLKSANKDVSNPWVLWHFQSPSGCCLMNLENTQGSLEDFRNTYVTLVCQKLFRKIINMLPLHKYSKIFKGLKRVHPNETEQRVAVKEITVHRKMVSDKFYRMHRMIRIHLPNKLEEKGEKMLFDFTCHQYQFFYFFCFTPTFRYFEHHK